MIAICYSLHYVRILFTVPFLLIARTNELFIVELICIAIIV